MKECDELRGAPFVRLGQIDVLEEENEVLALFGLEDTSVDRADLNAGLRELLEHVAGRGLRRAVDGGHLGRAQLGEALPEHERLAAAVRSDEQERLTVLGVEPWQDAVHAAQHLCRFHNGQLRGTRQRLDVRLVGLLFGQTSRKRNHFNS